MNYPLACILIGNQCGQLQLCGHYCARRAFKRAIYSILMDQTFCTFNANIIWIQKLQFERATMSTREG